MSNFEVFQCNTCSRKTEKLIVQTHAFVSKCTITHKCTGNLVRISKSDTKTMTDSSPDQSVTNWYPRTQAVSVGKIQEVQVPVYLNSALDVLSIAVADSISGGAIELDMILEIKKLVNATYIEYFYNKPSNTSLISGQDDSSKRVTLRFDNGASPDELVVYVNGVEINPSTYNRSIPGRIVFNSVLTDETNQIRILVFKPSTPEFVTLKFIKNDLAALISGPASAWNNVASLGIPKGNTHSIFTCTELGNLSINSQLSVVSVGNLSLSNADGYWLLADAPFTNYDRDLTTAISLAEMIDVKTVIEYKNDIKNIPKLFVNETIVMSLFPPISINSKLGNDVDLKLVNDSNTRLINSYIT